MSRKGSRNTALTCSNGALKRFCPFADSITSSGRNSEVAAGVLGVISVITVFTTPGIVSTDDNWKPHRRQFAGRVSCLRILRSPVPDKVSSLMIQSKQARPQTQRSTSNRHEAVESNRVQDATAR